MLTQQRWKNAVRNHRLATFLAISSNDRLKYSEEEWRAIYYFQEFLGGFEGAAAMDLLGVTNTHIVLGKGPDIEDARMEYILDTQGLRMRITPHRFGPVVHNKAEITCALKSFCETHSKNREDFMGWLRQELHRVADELEGKVKPLEVTV